MHINTRADSTGKASKKLSVSLRIRRQIRFFVCLNFASFPSFFAQAHVTYLARAKMQHQARGFKHMRHRKCRQIILSSFSTPIVAPWGRKQNCYSFSAHLFFSLCVRVHVCGCPGVLTSVSLLSRVDKVDLTLFLSTQRCPALTLFGMLPFKFSMEKDDYFGCHSSDGLQLSIYRPTWINQINPSLIRFRLSNDDPVLHV